MTLKVVFGVLLGATLGLGLHLLLSPVIGGTCRILCAPHRATVAGAVMGGVVALLAAGSGRGRGRQAGGPERS